MRWRPNLVRAAAACAFTCLTAGHAAAAEGPSPPPVEADSAAPADEESEVRSVASGKGFLIHPSEPLLGKFRFGIGGQYDAVDPAVMYGMNVRIPQLTIDARLGLGKGWSLKGHINTMLVTNEFLVGGAYAWHSGRWGLEASMSVGVYVGRLLQLGFDTTFFAPEYRPELTIGYDLGDGVALSLRGSLLLMGPEQVRVGDVWGGLDNSNAFVGHSEMLFVENTTSSNSIWWFGLGAMTTRAYYQLWVLFPDSPGLYLYPRAMVGYEF